MHQVSWRNSAAKSARPAKEAKGGPVSRLVVNDLGKKFGSADAVSGVNIEVQAGETVSLLGPSGCGKTTTLRCIAGFYRPDAGSIAIEGRTVAAPKKWVPPEERHLSMVFQNYVLWPHMSVAKNIAFGMKIHGYKRDAIAPRVAELCSMLGLQGLEGRYPHELSGGQQQRVAVARSLAVDPTLLLLDEPFSNLDAKLRVEMRSEMKSLLGRLGATALYVTHDQEEAMVVSDRIILMDAGRIIEQGAPRQLFETPRHIFTARFFGCTTFLQGRLTTLDGRTVLRSSQGELTYEVPDGVHYSGTGEVVLAARPDSIEVAADAHGLGWMSAQVLDCSYVGTSIEAQLSVGDTVLQARVPSAQWVDGKATVYVRFLPGSVHLLPAEAPSVVEDVGVCP